MRITRYLTMSAVAVLAASPLVSVVTAAATTATLNYDSTWTVDSTANSVSEYSAIASGAASALATISGADTHLSSPTSVAVDNRGAIFVSNSGNDSITEYAAGATADAAPIAVIAGSKTGLDGPASIAIDDDQLWVANPDSNLVEAFTIGTHGNELPAATFAGSRTKLDHPTAISVADDDFSGLISVLNTPATGSPTLTSYYPAPTGDESPLTVAGLSHLAPTAVFSDDFSDAWIVSGSTNSLTEVFTLPIPGATDVHVERRIKGAATGLDGPDSISQDALGRLVVTNAGNHSIEVFSANARGNVAPVRTITGVGSAASEPADGTVFGTAPAEPTAVTAKRHGRKVTLNWTPPAVTGGGVIGYDVDVETGTDGEDSGFSIGLSSDNGDVAVDTTKTTITKTIKPGKYYSFRISAVNAFGTSNESAAAHAAILTKPGKPTDVQAITHKHQMFVVWEPPSVDGGSRHLTYHVQYAHCVPGAAGCKFKVKRSSEAPALIGGLKLHTTYHVRVIARNQRGASKPSKVVKAKAFP